MNRTITIDGRPVEFRSTGAVPRIYRMQFNRDIFEDMTTVGHAVQGAMERDDQIAPEVLTLFENLAFVMAKAADPRGVPETPDEWLDGFTAFSIYRIFPELELLWLQNLTQLVEPAKK